MISGWVLLAIKIGRIKIVIVIIVTQNLGEESPGHIYRAGRACVNNMSTWNMFGLLVV